MPIRERSSSLMARIGRPSAGVIVATIALALSVTGNAAAAIIINSNGQVAQNTISGHHPPSGKHANVIAGSVTGADVQDESLTLSDIAGAASNGSISLSNIPNGRCNQVTFNFSGAQVGDSVIVTTGAAIQNGILLYANRVASAGHVEVNACNFSGTDMTAISGFPVRVVTLR